MRKPFPQLTKAAIGRAFRVAIGIRAGPRIRTLRLFGACGNARTEFS
jgi:hypothetical protein